MQISWDHWIALALLLFPPSLLTLPYLWVCNIPWKPGKAHEFSCSNVSREDFTICCQQSALKKIKERKEGKGKLQWVPGARQALVLEWQAPQTGGLLRSPPFLQVSCCSILAGPPGPQFAPVRGKGPPRHKDEFAESWAHPTHVIAGTE